MLTDFIYGENKGGERDIDVREKHQLVASHTFPVQELNLQPRYVPWLGIKPATFLCMRRCSN